MSSQKPGFQSLLSQRPYRAAIIVGLTLLVTIITLIGLGEIRQQAQDESASTVDPLLPDGLTAKNVDAMAASAQAAILPSDWWQTVQADIQAAEYHIN